MAMGLANSRIEEVALSYDILYVTDIYCQEQEHIQQETIAEAHIGKL